MSTAVAVRRPSAEPSHLADPLPRAGAAEVTPNAPRPPRTTSRRVQQPAAAPAPKPVRQPAEPPKRSDRTPRRVQQPAMSTPVPPAPVVEAPVVEAPVVKPAAKPVVKAAAKPKPKPAPEPAAASGALTPDISKSDVTKSDVTKSDVTEIDHTLGRARDLDSAFAALPIATAAEQRAGALVPAVDDVQVERPIVIRPDVSRPTTRFAPDPTRFTQRMAGAYSQAPAPTPGTSGKTPQPQITGTVVNTVSIKVQRDVVEAATVPPPIRHILPRPTASTIPPKELEAARVGDTDEREPELVELRPRTGPVPVPPLAHEPMPEPEHDDDPTAETPPAEAETRAIPVVGSLLGEIGGLPRVEVRNARAAAVTDTAPNPERQARESYELRARDLERVAHERLMREQQRLAVSIREQLAHDKRELESVLDNRLEDTVLRPVDHT